MSYHIGANSHNPAYTAAPRRLNADGAWVFNPGAGVSFDFRSTLCDPYWYGISPILKIIYLRDCDDRSILMGGAGGRFRYSVRKKLLIDLNLLAMIWLGSIWKTNKYNFSLLPFANISLQYCLTETVSIGPVFSIIPKSSRFSATSGFNILFISLTSSITLYKPEAP
ncbi:MAG: hypothetical protein K2X94_02040 [Amoebophilaceae bacterium]|nr:hypothetical protein [Amoebophilaceae bacterium]